MRLRKIWGKVLAGVMALSMLVPMASVLPVAKVSAANNTQTLSAQMPYRDLTAAEIVNEMGSGWNLGNTMDGHTGFTPNETLWQNVETTQALMKAVHDLGFNTVRIPVTWGTMIDDDNNYAIDEKWMSRVQDIVDYAVNMNMYAIINIHHDGAEQSGWFRIAAEDLDPVKEKYEAVWRQIAERFKDYDEHVIFESMNEVCGPGQNLAEDTALIMQFNQIFVDTVRSTGSNNAVRWLSVPGRYTNITNTTNPENGFALPKDSAQNKLFVAVHYYHWNFGMLENASMNVFDYASVPVLLEEFNQLKVFKEQGIPVILGEYGAINKMNDDDRAYHLGIINRMCQHLGVVPVYWDQGWYDLSMTPDFSYTLIDRATCEAIYPSIIAGMHRGLYLKGNEDLKDFPEDVVVTPITDLGTASGTWTLQVGDVGNISLADVVDKNAYNDIVLWKSADESVATVNHDNSNVDVWAGFVHATGIGQTVITAYSYDGGAVLEIPVEVRAKEATVPVTSIVTEKADYVLTQGESVYLNASTVPSDSDAFLTYRSTDTDVITVSKIGKVVATGVGSAYVVITSSDGLSTVIPVTVEKAEDVFEIDLALNVYFNDSDHSYFTNEYADPITVSGEGTYTLSFDCSKHLSEDAKAVGVTGLNNLTAIYIKDHSVTLGEAKKSPLVSCDIIYDKVVVDGKSYTVNMDAPKSALKASGIFDTNDPINSWDGSVISEVTVNNHVLNFSEIENPQKVEITFTLSNMVFDETVEEAAVVYAESLTNKGVTTAAASAGQPAEVIAYAAPAGCGKISFVSSDNSVAWVDPTALSMEADNSVKALVYAMGTGEATITAMTNNGITTTFTVTASANPDGSVVQLKATEVEQPEPAPEPEKPVEPEAPETPSSGEDKKEEDKEATAQPVTPEAKKASSGVLSTILLVVGILVLGVGVFLITMKVALGGGKKETPKEQVEAQKAEETVTEVVEETTEDK